MGSIHALTPAIVWLYGAYSFAHFFHARWVKARQNGMVGAWSAVGAIIDLTGFVSALLIYAFPVWVAVKVGVIPGVALFGAGLVLSFVLIGLSALMAKVLPEPMLWLLGSAAEVPLAIILGLKNGLL